MNVTLLVISLILIILGLIIRGRQLAYSASLVGEKEVKQWKQQNRLLAAYCQWLGVITLPFVWLVARQTGWLGAWFGLVVLFTIWFVIKVQKSS